MNDKQKVIDSFRGEYGFLSNFFEAPFYIEDVRYASVEHAYQAHKTLDESAKEIIRNAKSPAEAKKLGRCVQLRPDWDEVKVDLMKLFIQKKFENPFARHMLLSTNNTILIEGNTWNDVTWGVCKGVGQNLLGVILMETRSKIMEEESKDDEFASVE